uniref:Uncharacterized protein LOC114914004 n=1 Tax=Elaeis guineensis var. tenera TaxID=51953 RepID=A0A8N4F317_ELAGV|nr:uncharacterized protein LOC114914004 [Elaeis guineensis]
MLSTPYPQDASENGELSKKQKKWLDDDYVCRYTILNAMNNSLFDIFHKYFTTVELWCVIQNRYVNENAGNKSFIINKFIEYRMDDSRAVIDQINELNDIATECADAGEPISETFQVSTIIGKLPPSWSDYQKYLKHKKKSLSLDDLVKHIQIESEVRKRDEVVNQGKEWKKDSAKNKRLKAKNDKFKKKKKGPCCVCGKMRHIAKMCYHRKGKKFDETNMVGEKDDLIAMLIEVLMINTDDDWWVDLGVTCHVTPYKNIFKIYEEFKDEKSIFMRNSSSSTIIGKGM